MNMLLILSILFFLFIFPTITNAVCPVCTVAVGAGLGISRWIGIDDLITGIWIGGLIFSIGLWLADWIRKKNWKVPFPKIISIILMLIFVILPLYWSKMIGLTNNTLWKVDKVILGTVIGSVIFLAGVEIDKWLRKINNNKVYIYYQKVIVPLLLLTIASMIFYLITS